MDPSRQTSSLNARHIALKDSTQPLASALSPPPAYTPRQPVQSQHELIRDSALLLSRSPQGTLFANCSAAQGDDDEEDYQQEGISPISLRINTSINISKSNNLICLTTTPTEQANSIAQAVVKALQENSSGRCGIPMIDEDGRPRPVNIEVDASLVVEGAGNIIGSETIIQQVLVQRQQQLKRQREDEEQDESNTPARKRRDTSL